ncbi:MAG: TonB-dependent receptor [Xanthomonadaceae bacterium]|nr:TonB-dependent receptor [Xanthomonadaceae bacterium]
MNSSKRIRISQLSMALAVALTAPVMAQNTSSAIGGRITSNDGKPVAGATVSIKHNQSGSVSSAVTDAEGRYSSRGLRVGGPYTVTITKDGVTETRDNVYLQLAETKSLDASLGQKVLDSVTVTGVAAGSEVFSATNMGAGTNISPEQLKSFASIQRNLQDYARLDPRLSQTDKERGEISVGGQNSRFNSITIDSVATNDTFGLESNNLPTAKQPISIDAIESVQINISNYDVTQKGYTGANINAVTKSGTNDFHGSLSYVYRSDSMAGDRYNRSTDTYSDPPDFKEETIGFTLGGPIIKDNLFFFAAYEELTSTRGGPAAGPAGSDRFNVPITTGDITAAQNIATNVWGIDIGSADAAAAELKVKDALIKLDANIGDNHRASLRWSKTEQDEPLYPSNFTSGGLAMSLDSHWYTQAKSIETWVGQFFSDWSENFSTEFKVSYRDYASEPVNNSNLPQIRLNFSGAVPDVTGTSAGLLAGTERSRHFNDLATETWNYYGGANWFLGDHELKFGFDYDDNDVYNAFLQDTRGNYTFDCINASGTVVYTDPTLTGLGNFSCSALTRAQYTAAMLENFSRGRPTSYAVQVGINGFDLNDGVANWDYQNLGLFLQDTWAVNTNLTLSYGVRIDRKSMGVSPEFNAAAAAAAVNGFVTGQTTPGTGTTTRATGGYGYDNTNTLDGNSLFQPRVGFNYTFDSEKPMQVRGGFGLFEGAAANVWLSNPYSNTGITTGIISCSGTGSSACPRNNGFFSPNPDSQPGIAGSPPAPNVDFLSANLEQPSVWKANLAFEKELAAGVVMSLEYVRTIVEDGIYYKHLNLGQATRQGIDGRDLFYHPVGFSASCYSYNSSGGLVTSTSGACGAPTNMSRTRALSNRSFNNVLLAERTGKGGGGAFTVAFSGRAFEELDWSLGFTTTNATEVSPLTSSVSNSNWNSVSIFNANEEVAANSAYLVKDRFTGSLNWKHNFFSDYATRFGVFYEGRKGKPYSWIYNNDLNGDGTVNDLMYIPTALGSGEVVFKGPGTVTAAQAEATFWSVIEAQGLSGFAGGSVDRNSSFAPWTNTFDVRISQELPGFFKGNKATLIFDILNFGNLLNKDWGRIDEIAFSSGGGLSRSFVDYMGLDASGRYIYGVNGTVEDFVTRNNSGESAWAAQVTLKYEF